MQVTKEMAEAIYAHVSPMKGMLVSVQAYCDRAAEMFPGIDVNPANLKEVMESLYESIRYVPDYQDDTVTEPIEAFRINNNRIPDIVGLRELLFESVRARQGADGWCDAFAIVADNPALDQKLSEFGFVSPLEALKVLPMVYTIEGHHVRLNHDADRAKEKPAEKSKAAPRTPHAPADVRMASRLAAAIDSVLPEPAGTDDDWLLLAKLGAAPAVKEVLQETGLKFRAALDKYLPDRYEIVNTTPDLPTAALKMRRKPGAEPVGPAPRPAAKSKPKSAFELLASFAVFLKYNDAIAALAKKALPENWHFGKGAPENYRILKNYFEITFERLMYEDHRNRDKSDWQPKIRISADESFAIFNTGLVDALYDPIYAFFRRNTNDKREQQWFFDDFVCETDPKYLQQVVRIFAGQLPEPAQYFSDPAHLVFNPKLRYELCDWQHILVERCSRFPVEFLRDVITGYDSMTRPDGKPDFPALARHIESNPEVFRRMRGRVTDAIELALKRVHWNFRTAVPIYYPKKHITSILLPLSLTGHGHAGADIALVLKADLKAGIYTGETILDLEHAYTDARLLTRLDPGWLDAAEIGAAAEE